MITKKTVCWLIGLLTCWLCVPSEAMAARASYFNIWVTSGNGHDTGITQNIQLIGDTASFYLWGETPGIAAATDVTNQTVKLNFVLTGTANDYNIACDQWTPLAEGESLVASAVSGNNSAQAVSTGTTSTVFNITNEAGINIPDSMSQALNNGVYCLGKITFSNIDPSVDEILFTLGDQNLIQGGDGYIDDSFWSYGFGTELSWGNIATETLGSTVVRLYRSSEPVPEPSTYAILTGIGLVGTAWASRRRRRNAGTK